MRRDDPDAELPLSESAERQLGSHFEVLRGLIAASDRSEADVEARLGWRRHHLRQVLDRQRSLKYDELFTILEAIGVKPQHYFALVASPETEH